MSETKSTNNSSLELPEVNWLDRDSDPSKFFKDLSYALSEFGFMVLTNAPGLSDDFQQNAFKEVRSFFDSPKELKKTAYIAKTPPHFTNILTLKILISLLALIIISALKHMQKKIGIK